MRASDGMTGSESARKYEVRAYVAYLIKLDHQDIFMVATFFCSFIYKILFYVNII